MSDKQLANGAKIAVKLEAIAISRTQRQTGLLGNDLCKGEIGGEIPMIC